MHGSANDLTNFRRGRCVLGGAVSGQLKRHFFVSCQLGADHLKAVYKPEIGQTELFDFEPNSACRGGKQLPGWCCAGLLVGTSFRRQFIEKMAYLYGAGSLQLYIEHDPRRHYLGLEDAERDQFRPVALFDLVVTTQTAWASASG